MVENNRKRKIPGVFLLPNLITTSALFSGFYSVIASINGNFLDAVFAILIAILSTIGIETNKFNNLITEKTSR